jgi:hypothetical protein
MPESIQNRQESALIMSNRRGREIYCFESAEADKNSKLFALHKREAPAGH